MSETTTLYGLFVSSFLAATLLPGGSEAVLYAAIRLHPDAYWDAILVATLGNTLGGLSSYAVGRLVPKHYTGKGMDVIRRHGAPALLLAWAPLIGDALCVAAGWLRVNPVAAALYIALGKFARYAAIAWLAA
jgi:Predicted membrane protein